MKCKSCQEEVSSKFAYALSTNACPFCGQEIIDEELKDALNNLREAMTVVDTYPVEIFDWLKSNFGLLTSAELDDKLKEASAQIEIQVEERAKKLAAARVPKVITKDGVQPTTLQEGEVAVNAEGNQIQGPAIQDQVQTSKFFKNAEADKIMNRNQHLKDIVKQIKKGGSVGTDADGGQMNITPEMMAHADPEEIEQWEQMITGGAPEVSSAFGGSMDDEEDIPAAVLAFSSGGAGASADYNAKDMAAQQRMMQKAKGKGSGGFRRG
jgi:hypothetical protein